jgi:hypothetical protein
MSGQSRSAEEITAIQTDALDHLERATACVNNAAETLKILQTEDHQDHVRVRITSALAGEIQAAYTGFENVASRVLKADNIVFQKSASFHSELLRTAFEKGLVDESSESILLDLLGFRHFFRNAYGVALRHDEVISKA